MDSSVKIVIYKKSNGKTYYAFVDANTKIYDPSWEKYNELTIRNSKYYMDYKNSPIGSGFEQWYVISSNGLKAYDAQGYIATYEKSEL